jgi:hypothetical protein
MTDNKGNPSGIPQETLHKIEAQTEKRAAGKLRKETEALKEQLDMTNQQIGILLNAQNHLDDTVPRIKAMKRVASQSTAVAIASDWHIEEVVYKDRVNGLNEFNPKIADKRINMFFERLVYLTDIQRNATDIDTLVLGLLGDFITGYIHEELEETNSMSPAEALVWVLPRILEGFRYLKATGNFKRIIVPCCVGNHARTTKKKRVKTMTQNSYEWILYHVLAMSVEGVEFHIAQGYHQMMDIYDQKVRCHHGDSIRYGGGVGGITIPVNKKIAQWDKSVRADLDLFGHYHQTIFERKWICNGSLIGYSEFANQIGAEYEPPQQAFFLMKPGRSRTIHAPIFLD